MEGTAIITGGIYWCDENGTVGLGGKRRPAVIVKAHEDSAIIVFLTATDHQAELPTHVLVDEAPEPSSAICEKVTTVTKSAIRGPIIGQCRASTFGKIVKAIGYSIGGMEFNSILQSQDFTENSWKQKYQEEHKKSELYRWMLEQIKGQQS